MGDNSKFLWPSQKSWTLPTYIREFFVWFTNNFLLENLNFNRTNICFTRQEKDRKEWHFWNQSIMNFMLFAAPSFKSSWTIRQENMFLKTNWKQVNDLFQGVMLISNVFYTLENTHTVQCICWEQCIGVQYTNFSQE